MEFNLNDFKFMQGFAAARQFLLHLRSAKLAEAPMNRKNTSTNSLSFSPIARRQSQICQHSSQESLPSKHKRSPSLQQQQKPSELPNPQQSQQTPRQNNSMILSPTQQLKDKINKIIVQLNYSYNQLVISETALDILKERLQAKKSDFLQIEKLKNEERDKHVKILTLKNSILKKREKLTQKRMVREKFREVVAGDVRGYVKDMEEDNNIEVIPIFAKDFKIIESQQFAQILPQQLAVQYPQQLNLRFRKIKKKDKKKSEQPTVPTTSQALPPPMPEPMATFFAKEKKSKSFGNYDAEIQSYCDDAL